jgi:Fe-S cluster assembly ATP-binding protein
MPTAAERPEPLLSVEALHARPTSDSDQALPETLAGIDLQVLPGEVHALMGPNGSGKSTLASVLMGSPEYEVLSGRITFKGHDITAMAPDERARLGVFLAFQYPQEVPGVPVRQFLRQALTARKGVDMSILEVRIAIMEWMDRLGMDPAFADRYLNDGFSGGEKKRNEVLQMAILEPDLAVLDETDSGLDIDALRTVGKGITEIQKARPNMASLVITHYQRMLDYVQPDIVHVLVDGRIVETGGPELAKRVEADGFEALRAATPSGGEPA